MRNQTALSRKERDRYSHAVKGEGRGGPQASSPRKGDCRQWAKEGKCSRGDDCSWASSHTKDKAGKRTKTPGERGRSPKGKGKGKGKSKSKPPKRDQSPKKVPKKGEVRGTSPSGVADKPPCFKYLNGTCTAGKKCDYWHPPACKFHAEGKCEAGKSCSFLHLTDGKVAAPAPKAQAQLFFQLPSCSASSYFSCLQSEEVKKVHFTASDKKKSYFHNNNPTVVRWNLRCKNFQPFRSNPDGSVILKHKEEI